MRACGLDREKKAFRPHVTLGRWRRPDPSDAAAWLEAHSDFVAPPFAVDAFHLVSSLLLPEGARHRREASFALGERLP